MVEFRASSVVFEVQRSFANKFFSSRAAVGGMLEPASADLLDRVFLLLLAFVSKGITTNPDHPPSRIVRKTLRRPRGTSSRSA